MKTLKIIVISLFSLVLLLPMILFNHKPNAVSQTDNRMLAESPFSPEVWGKGEFTENFDKYIEDRIGLREEMILAKTTLYDIFFGEFVHPMYTSGKNDYLFGSGITTASVVYNSYHERFALMVKEIQDYCDARGVPFVFVFNPAKPALYKEHLPSGINYSRQWVTDFLGRLDKLGVRYVDNTKVLQAQKDNGVAVFNRKYDPNHWNYIGAYHGTNSVIAELMKDYPSLKENTDTDFVLSYEHKETLLQSQYPINEDVPKIEFVKKAQNDTDKYKDDIYLNKSYANFGYYVNSDRKSEGAPKLLMFQGSYMNEYGKEFMANAFSEYIHVHDYQNVIDFPYYYNAFKPDCVVFEVAEYTFMSTYFSYEKMGSINYNPTLASAINSAEKQEERVLNISEVVVTEKGEFVEIEWKTTAKADYVWLKLEQEYDFSTSSSGFITTVPKQDYLQNTQDLKIYVKNVDSVVCYS